MQAIILSLLVLLGPSLQAPHMPNLDLPDLSGLMGHLGGLLQVAVDGGAAAGGAGAGADAAAAGATVPAVITSPVVTAPVMTAPATSMMAAVLPGIGIGLLAGTVIAEILVSKKPKKLRSHGGYSSYHQAGYGYGRARARKY